MSVNKIEIQDSNGNTYHPQTSADVVFGADGKPIATVLPLAHSKTGKTHNLSGTIPQSGIVSAQSKATADYNDGDSITVNGQPYTLLQGSFKANIPMAMLVDVGAKTVTVGGSGGGSMADFKSHNLVTSGRYDVVGSQWINEVVPSGNSMSYRPAIIGDKSYMCSGPTSIYERNLITNVFTRYTMQNIANASFNTIFNYNDELYILGRIVTSPYSTQIYKADLVSKSYTLYMNFPDSAKGISSDFSFLTQVSANKFVSVSSINAGQNQYGALIFDMLSHTFKSVVLSPYVKCVERVGVSQRLDDGNWLFGIVETNSTSLLKVYKYFIESDTLSPFGNITLPAPPIQLQSQQLGNKLIYLYYPASNNKDTGEMDLLNLIIDSTKYPNAPSIDFEIFDTLIYQNELIKYTPDRKIYLPLISTPPEDNAIALVIMKGQSYSSLYRTIHIDAIPSKGQSAFDITPKEQIATTDLFIHLGQYQTLQNEIVNVWRLK